MSFCGLWESEKSKKSSRSFSKLQIRDRLSIGIARLIGWNINQKDFKL